MGAPMDFPDGSWVQFLVWSGRRSEASASVYDTAQYDLDVYDGSTDITWTPYQSKVMTMDIRRGKDAFLKRFRTGTAKFELDNSSGEFTTGGMLPGDYVWIQALRFTPPDSFVTFSLFYGRVNHAEDIVRGGVDITKVRCTDLQADLALIDRAAEVAQGAGETTAARMQRIVANAGQTFTTNQVWPTVATMQATTLAGQALSEAQLTMDSEGGDMWLGTGPNFVNGGTVEFAGRDWLTEAPRSTVEQWLLGGSGLPLINGRITKARQLIVNDATFASAGGTAQQATDGLSIQRYGRQTTRRLDLICVGDAQPLFLAARTVANLSQIRPRVTTATTPVDDTDAADYGYGVQFGDLVTVHVDSINGWGLAFAAHVIGIEHSMWGDEWFVTVTLDDAFIENVDGAFSYLEFDDSFGLGGQP